MLHVDFQAISMDEKIEADLAEISFERVLGIDPLEMVHHFGEAIDLGGLERQRLPHLAGGAAAAGLAVRGRVAAGRRRQGRAVRGD